MRSKDEVEVSQVGVGRWNGRGERESCSDGGDVGVTKMQSAVGNRTDANL